MFSKDWYSHLEHINRVLEALGKAGLTANPKKCEWGGCKLIFLGHMIGSGTLAVPKDRVDAMANFGYSSTETLE